MLTENEKIRLERWVRCSVIQCLPSLVSSSTTISSSNRVIPVHMITQKYAIGLLIKIGFVYDTEACGYTLPSASSLSLANATTMTTSTTKKVFTADKELLRYLAQHGIPKQTNWKGISIKDRLSLEVFLACHESWNVL
jgi:phosphoribosylaminoimidazole-succinocarboxamide synthase